jgi:hypothetical protein
MNRIYACLRQIALILGPENSFIRPDWYTRIFVTVDIVCIVVHAAGGGIAFTGDMAAGASNSGIQIITVALALQIVALAIFHGLFISILVRSYYSRRSLKAVSSLAKEKTRAVITPKFKMFVAMLLVVCTCIIIRCGYRVAAYSGGFTSEINRNEGLFIGLDSVMMTIALVGLAAFSPAIFLDQTL